MQENEKISNKDKTKIMLISLSLFFCFIGFSLGYLLFDKVIKTNEECQREGVDIYSIEPIVKEYLSINNRTVYLYNTNEVKIINGINKISLKDYLKTYQDLDKVFQDLDSYLEVDKELKDGGTIIYKTKKDRLFFDRDLTIIKCNTKDGNKDVYIGEYMNTLTAFENGACGKDFFTDAEFTRVYKITKILEKDKVDNYHLVLLTIDDKNGKSITIERKLTDESLSVLKENEDFIFYFENKYQELIKEDIEEIFNKCTLTGVVPNK